MHTPFGDGGEYRQTTMVIEYRMHFYRFLTAAVSGPIEYLQAERDDRCIRQVDIPFQLFKAITRKSVPLPQFLIKVPEQFITAVSVDIGQARSALDTADTQMIDVTCGAPQALADITDRTRSSYMAEQHRHKVGPAVDSLTMFIATVLFYQPVEFFPRKIRQHLTE